MAEKKDMAPLDKLQALEEKVETLKGDIGGLLDATKELTKVIGDLNAQWDKWRKAGKF